jgi:hypothetical protein
MGLCAVRHISKYDEKTTLFGHVLRLVPKRPFHKPSDALHLANMFSPPSLSKTQCYGPFIILPTYRTFQGTDMKKLVNISLVLLSLCRQLGQSCDLGAYNDTKTYTNNMSSVDSPGK